VQWQSSLRAVTHLGAFRTRRTNLTTNGTAGEPVIQAIMSPVGFEVAGIRPLMGRFLTASDAVSTADPVVVISYKLWQSRFGGDRNVIGRSVKLSGDPATVVGVMPAGFGFPIAHELWTPLRVATVPAPHEGPSLHVFGVLAPGATLEQAQTELEVVQARNAVSMPGTYEQVRPQVMPYTREVMNLALGVAGSLDLARFAFAVRTTMNAPLVLFLLLVCGNVALLIFARGATREREISVRNALGASRGRIMMQLFVEALVLGGLAAAAGLFAVSTLLQSSVSALHAAVFENMPLPFWFHFDLSTTTILYAFVLTIIVYRCPSSCSRCGMKVRN
jgi:hypothetical protein